MAHQKSVVERFTFFITLRFIARVYFLRKSARKAIEPEFNNCPIECLNSAKYYDAARFKYCDSCPHKIEKDGFREEVEGELRAILGERLKYSFDDVLPVFYSLTGIADADLKSLSAKRAEMYSVYMSEKNRADEIEQRERDAQNPM